MNTKYTTEEIVSAIKSCPNINAAIKNILRKEVGNDARLARFFKDLREVCQSSQSERLTNFVNKHMEDHSHLFLSITRYGHFAKVDQITAPIIEKYADEFNSTYEAEGEGIKIKDKEKFKKIAKEVVGSFNDSLKEHGLPDSKFMQEMLITTLFDANVAPEVVAVTS
jgi:hypothetical protein